MFNSYEIVYDRTTKVWPFNTDDLIKLTGGRGQAWLYLCFKMNDYCTALTRHWFFSYHYKYTFCFTKQWYYLLYPEQTLWVRTGRKVGISLTHLTLQQLCACPKFAPEFPTPFDSWSFCVQWLEVRCGYFFSWYIGVIVDHHCITFSYIDMEQFLLLPINGETTHIKA
jgi:hypothetical protein